MQSSAAKEVMTSKMEKLKGSYTNSSAKEPAIYLHLKGSKVQILDREGK